MAEDNNLKSRALIAKGYGPILRKVIIKILDAGPAGTPREDQQIYNERRRREGKDKPQHQDNSRPFKPQRPQITYPIQTTLPELPEIQPIPIPPYQPPVNQPSPEPSPNPPATPSVDPKLEGERRRAQDEYEKIQREIAEQQKKNDETNRKNDEIRRQNDEKLRGYEDARSRLIRDTLRENQREKDEQERARQVHRVVPAADNPFGGPTSYILQTNNSSGEMSFGDKLTRAI